MRDPAGCCSVLISFLADRCPVVISGVGYFSAAPSLHKCESSQWRFGSKGVVGLRGKGDHVLRHLLHAPHLHPRQYSPILRSFYSIARHTGSTSNIPVEFYICKRVVVG